MKRPLWVFILVVPLIVGAVAFVGSKFGLILWIGELLGGRPRIEYSTVIDVGVRELGDQVIAPIAISNRGWAPLTIDEIRTTCSCAGLEREVDGKLERVDELRLTSGATANLFLRVRVRGVRPGSEMRTVVTFRTNDPNHPSGTIVLLVPNTTAGLSANPSDYSFGTVKIGTPVRQTLAIRDSALKVRTPSKATSSDPERVRVRLLPCDEPSDLNETPNRDGPVISYVEITISTLSPGDIQAVVHVDVVDNAVPALSIPITGRIVGSFEVRPATVVLPRRTSEGILYSAAVLCHTIEPGTFTIAVDTKPEGMSVEIQDTNEDNSKWIRISWDQARNEVLGTEKTRKLGLRARVGAREELVSVTVHINPEKDSP